jgi:hypothetical protein
MSGVTSRVVISALLLLVGAASGAATGPGYRRHAAATLGVLCTQAALAASPE